MSNELYSDLYINREMSWLKFNERVLEEAEAPDTPLFERLRFVSIFNSNLDEFYMIRVGSLYDRSLIKVKRKDDKTGMDAEEQLDAVFARTRELLPRRDLAYSFIIKELSRLGLEYVNINKLSSKHLAILKYNFELHYQPLLAPQIIDNKHPFPHLINKELYVGVLLKSKTKETRHFGLIPISKMFERLVIFKDNHKTYFLLSEELIQYYASTVFDIYDVIDSTIFRLTRNADIEVNEGLYDEDLDYREMMKKLIKKRSKLAPVRLEISSSISKEFKDYLFSKLSILDRQLFICHSPMDLSFISRLENHIDKRHFDNIMYPPRTPQACISLNSNDSIIKQVLRKDALIHVPFETIQPIVRLLHEAAYDKRVVSIKITLYRLARESQIIDALTAASESGKQVTALVELKARFDESNNIGWATTLEDAGCNVLYGVEDYKVHSKLILITFKDGNAIRYITYVGTGNFNEITAKVYTDLGILTANKTLSLDAEKAFKNLTLSNIHATYDHLLVAPQSYKNKLLECIDNEIKAHRITKDGYIMCKFNSLTDKDFIDKFYEASKAGVKVDLIIRGICCLRCGVPEISENINVISIVGRFLEHSRIFWFRHGPDNRPAIYIGSGDLMTRNTERRVEIAIPVYDSAIRKRIENILEISLKDNVKARKLLPDGSYLNVEQGAEDEELNSQTYFYDEAYRLAKEKSGNKVPITNRIATGIKDVSNWLDKLASRLGNSQ